MLEELRQYHRLCLAWGLGPLKLHRGQGDCLEIWAKYRDVQDHRVREAFLGRGTASKAWYQALQRVRHVKSFL